MQYLDFEDQTILFPSSLIPEWVGQCCCGSDYGGWMQSPQTSAARGRVSVMIHRQSGVWTGSLNLEAGCLAPSSHKLKASLYSSGTF